MSNIILPSGGRLGPASDHAKNSGKLVQALYMAVKYRHLDGTAPIPGLLRQVMAEDAWREYSKPHSPAIIHTYATFKAFVEDWLEVTLDDLKAICTSEHDNEALGMMDACGKTTTPTKGSFGGNLPPRPNVAQGVCPKW